MTFDSIFNLFGEMVPVSLQPEKDSSISLVTEEPFYIIPSFVDLTVQKSANIYVVSAPGATGKSALAKYLAYKYSSIYWDLADITLGDNSFIGTLVRSVGAENYSEYMSNLIKGKTMLIIDAFDEAEMISGTKAVKSFLSDVSKSVSKAEKPCVILLSRAETAQSICAYFNEINTSFSHYEISFFAQSQSEDYVKQVVKSLQKNPQNEEIITNCVKQYLDNVSRLVPSEELNSFVGYAPVLQVIGEHIAPETNAYSFLNALKSEKMKGIDVIAKILDNLLEREHTKVKDSFIRRIENSFDCSQLDIEKVYSPAEQLIDILSFVLFGEYDDSLCYNSFIPDEIRDEYVEVVRMFLPQHPFLRSAKGGEGFEFTGPAFRDYVLSLLIEDKEKEEIVQLFFDEKRISNHFPSHLLWNFYTRKEEVSIPSNRVSYLFESFRSQTKGDAQAFLTIDGSKETGYSSEWTICSPKKEVETSENYEVELLGDSLWFENLYNTFVDVDDLHVLVQNRSNNIQFSHSSVLCNELRICGDRIIFDAYDGADCLLVSQNEAQIQTRNGNVPEIIINGDNLSVSLPNIALYFKLIKYGIDYSKDSSFSIAKFTYILRKIFVQFRKHRKDTPARDAEKIDFIIVGSDPKRQAVFNYLLNNGIIYRDAHLYKIHMEKLEASGISWGAVTRGDTKQLELAYTTFCNQLGQ